MSRYFKQMEGKHNAARSGLNERLARKEIGDEAYDEMVAKGDDGTFKRVGLVLVAIFAGIVLVVTLLGY